MPEIEEYFVDGGHRPGFPGNHGPGVYLVDYENRTIRPKPIEQSDEQVQEETPSEPHPGDNTEGSQQGGVIPEAAMAIGGEAGGDELLTLPEGATINPNLPEEGAEPTQE